MLLARHAAADHVVFNPNQPKRYCSHFNLDSVFGYTGQEVRGLDLDNNEKTEQAGYSDDFYKTDITDRTGGFDDPARFDLSIAFPDDKKSYPLPRGCPVFLPIDLQSKSTRHIPFLCDVKGLHIPNLTELFRRLSYLGVTTEELDDSKFSRSQYQTQPDKTTNTHGIWIHTLFGKTVPVGTQLFIDVVRTLEEYEKVREYTRMMKPAKTYPRRPAEADSASAIPFIFRPITDNNLTQDCINANRCIGTSIHSTGNVTSPNGKTTIVQIQHSSF
jgi:hypothetical protein